METTVTKTKLSNICDADSGVCLADTTQTIQEHLNRSELWRYTRAMNKVDLLQGLNLKDLNVLDKIDALTFERHGMCLKDSLVTKARLKACKKYRIKFIDRDGLVDHMNRMLPGEDECDRKSSFKGELVEFFIEKLGKNLPHKLRAVMVKLNAKKNLDLEELNFLSDMEIVASRELGWTIINPDLMETIDTSCKKLGIYFQNLQKVIAN